MNGVVSALAETTLGLFRLLGLVAQEQRGLGERERDGDRHDAEDLEAHPEIGGLRAPHDLVQGRQGEEEQGPAQGELAPALLGDLEHAVEHDLRSEEHTSELQSRQYLVCRLLLEKKKQKVRLDQGYSNNFD